MKKIITVLALFAAFGLSAQKEVARHVSILLSQGKTFTPVNVLAPSATIENADTRKAVTKASFAKLGMQPLSDVMAQANDNIELAVPYQGATITVQLYKVNLFAEGFHLDTDKAKNVPYERGLYYRGIIKGDQESVAAFSFFNNELNGIVSSKNLGNLVVGKLNKAGNSTDYIIYSDSDLKILNTAGCHTKDIDNASAPAMTNRAAGALSEHCVTMYFEIDYNLYQENDSSITTTNNWMTSVFNNVQTLYNNDGITVALRNVFIWTSEDPYSLAFDDTASSADYLYMFNDVRPVFDGDVGQLIGIDEGGLGGVAVTIDGLCGQDNFSYGDVNFDYSTVPTFSWTIEVITHEMGHLLGSRHTHGCYWNGNNTAIDGCGSSVGYTEGDCEQGPIPSSSVKGTIMSYCHLISGVGIGFNNGFGPQPKAAILDAIATADCLGSDCINTCINTVANIMMTPTSATSANISWTELGDATSWQISVSPFSSTTPVWNTVTSTSYTVSGLLPNTFYKALVRPICTNGLVSGNEPSLFVTGADWCNGITITDTGGEANEYTDAESYVRTIIPNLPNKKISLAFSAFDLEQDYDYLWVYDGNSTSAPDLSGGGFTGNSIPGPFVSSAADGSLTVKFTSDGGVTAQGYVASVACQTQLGTSGFGQDIDFTYYPNPTNGVINIQSATPITGITVYNALGQLLYQDAKNLNDRKIDLSQFANGTYFFKLKFNDREANFKIMKTN